MERCEGEAEALEACVAGGDDGGSAGSCFDRLAVSGAADRDCATDCGRDGTGGGCASALFDVDGRVGSKVIDRDLRNVRDSLRRRVPVEEEATDGARVSEEVGGGGNFAGEGWGGGRGC